VVGTEFIYTISRGQNELGSGRRREEKEHEKENTRLQGRQRPAAKILRGKEIR
jgi:hypothetical protein